MSEKRPVSPINGQPLPKGRPFTSETAREAGKKGGRKAAINILQRKTLREELLALITADLTDKNGKTMNTQTAMSAAMIKKAISGDVRAYEMIRDTIGEKPTETVSIVSADYRALDDAFNGLKNASGSVKK